MSETNYMTGHFHHEKLSDPCTFLVLQDETCASFTRHASDVAAHLHGLDVQVVPRLARSTVMHHSFRSLNMVDGGITSIDCKCASWAVRRTSLVSAINEFASHCIEESLKPASVSVLDAISEWQGVTFAGQAFDGTLMHFVREFAEFMRNPHDGSERADLVHLLVQLARLDGSNLRQEIEAKFATNKTRRWKAPDAQGVIEHE